MWATYGILNFLEVTLLKTKKECNKINFNIFNLI
jgi:hypothetical protein